MAYVRDKISQFMPSATTFTVSMPINTVIGDVVVFSLCFPTGAIIANWSTSFSGFTRLVPVDETAKRYHIFYKKITSQNDIQNISFSLTGNPRILAYQSISVANVNMKKFNSNNHFLTNEISPPGSSSINIKNTTVSPSEVTTNENPYGISLYFAMAQIPSNGNYFFEDRTVEKNNIQYIEYLNNITSGSYTLTHNGATSAAINIASTNTQIRDAIANISNIGAGNVTVTNALNWDGTENTSKKIVTLSNLSTSFDGAYTGISANVLTSSTSLVANAWVGAKVFLLTNTSASGTGNYGIVTANTSTTITVSSWITGGGTSPTGSGSYRLTKNPFLMTSNNIDVAVTRYADMTKYQQTGAGTISSNTISAATQSTATQWAATNNLLLNHTLSTTYYNGSFTSTGGTTITVTADPSGSSTVAMSTNAFVGCSVVITSVNSGNVNPTGVITSNTATQITVSEWRSGSPGSSGTFRILPVAGEWENGIIRATSDGITFKQGTITSNTNNSITTLWQNGLPSGNLRYELIKNKTYEVINQTKSPYTSAAATPAIISFSRNKSGNVANNEIPPLEISHNLSATSSSTTSINGTYSGISGTTLTSTTTLVANAWVGARVFLLTNTSSGFVNSYGTVTANTTSSITVSSWSINGVTNSPTGSGTYSLTRVFDGLTFFTLYFPGNKLDEHNGIVQNNALGKHPNSLQRITLRKNSLTWDGSSGNYSDGCFQLYYGHRFIKSISYMTNTPTDSYNIATAIKNALETYQESSAGYKIARFNKNVVINGTNVKIDTHVNIHRTVFVLTNSSTTSFQFQAIKNNGAPETITINVATPSLAGTGLNNIATIAKSGTNYIIDIGAVDGSGISLNNDFWVIRPTDATTTVRLESMEIDVFFNNLLESEQPIDLLSVTPYGLNNGYQNFYADVRVAPLVTVKKNILSGTSLVAKNVANSSLSAGNAASTTTLDISLKNKGRSGSSLANDPDLIATDKRNNQWIYGFGMYYKFASSANGMVGPRFSIYATTNDSVSNPPSTQSALSVYTYFPTARPAYIYNTSIVINKNSTLYNNSNFGNSLFYLKWPRNKPYSLGVHVSAINADISLVDHRTLISGNQYSLEKSYDENELVYRFNAVPQSAANSFTLASTTLPTLASSTSSADPYIWAYSIPNLPPIKPGTQGLTISPSGNIGTLTPVFEAQFADENGRWGEQQGTGLNLEDCMTNYQIQVFRGTNNGLGATPDTSLVFWDYKAAPDSVQQNADKLSIVYGGATLENEKNYFWRVRFADIFSEWSDWSDWIQITPSSKGTLNFIAPQNVNTLSTSKDKTESLQPNLQIQWSHPYNYNLKKITFDFKLTTSADYSQAVIDNLNISPSGDTVSIPWSQIVFTPPLYGTLEFGKQYIISSMRGWDDGSISVGTNLLPSTYININNPPTLSSFYVNGTELVSGAKHVFTSTFPTISFSGSDVDDDLNNVKGYIRISKSGYTYLSPAINVTDPNTVTGSWSLAVTSAIMPPYGAYTVEAMLKDESVYTGGSQSDTFATTLSRTIVYTTQGSITLILSGDWVNGYTGPGTQSGLTPAITVNWISASSRALKKVTAKIYTDLNGVRGNVIKTSQELNVTIFNTNQIITWQEWNFDNNSSLNQNTYYWIELTGFDEDGLSAANVLSGNNIRFKTNKAPYGTNLVNTPIVKKPTNAEVIAATTSNANYPMFQVTINDDDDTSATGLRGLVRIVRPDQTVVENLIANYSGVYGDFVYQSTAAEINQYGVYSWQVKGDDGELETPYTSLDTFRYTKKGNITNFQPTTYQNNLYNQVRLTPSFSGTWISSANVNLKSLRVQISSESSFSSFLYNGIYTFPTPIAPNATFLVTWADLGFTSGLTPESSYYYRMQGTDIYNVIMENDYIPYQTIKAENGPSLPELIDPASELATVSYPILKASITDTDTQVGNLVIKFKITRPDNTVVTDLTGTFVSTSLNKHTYQFALTATQLTSYGRYTWAATGYDGTLYSGNSTTLGSASYQSVFPITAAAGAFRYTVAGVITLQNPTYPVSGLSIVGNNPIFNAQWYSAANRNLVSVKTEIYKTVGGVDSLVAEQTRSYNVASSTSPGTSFSFAWTQSSLDVYGFSTLKYKMIGTDVDGITTSTSLSSITLNSAPSLSATKINNTTLSTTENSPTNISVSGTTPANLSLTATYSDSNTNDKISQYQIIVSEYFNNAYYIVATLNQPATASEKTNNAINYTMSNSYLARGLKYRLQITAYDSFYASSSVITVYFLWSPTALKNIYNSLEVTAFIADNRIVELIASNAPLLPSINSGVENQASANIIQSYSKLMNLLTTALIQNPYSIQASAIIIKPGGLYRHVRYPGSSDWKNNNYWYVTDAEKTDGETFVSANYSIGYEFFAYDSYLVQGIGIAYNSMITGGSGSNGGGVATLTLERYDDGTWTTIYTQNITTTQLRQNNKTTMYGQTATWLIVEPLTNVSIESGDRLCVSIKQSGIGANYLVSPGSTGKNSVEGNVLNCMMVTNINPSFTEDVSWLLPNWLTKTTQTQIGTSLYLDETPLTTVNTLVTSVDCPITFDENNAVSLKITNLAIINGGLTMKPVNRLNHCIYLEDKAGLILNSVINIEGSPKTRYAKTTQSYDGSVTEIQIDRAVTGWELDDEIYIQDGLTALQRTRVFIYGADEDTVFLKNSINLRTNAGVYVVNITRDAGFKSVKQNANIAVFDNSTLRMHHAFISDFAGNPVLNPGPYTLVDFQDLIFETGANTYSGLDLDAAHYVEDLTIISDEITAMNQNYVPTLALITNGDWTHFGEILLINSGSILANSNISLNLIVIDPFYSIPQASVIMSSDSVLDAQIDASFIPYNRAIILCNESNIQKIFLHDSKFFYSNNNTQYGIVYVGEQSSLFALDIQSSESNYPWVYLMPSGSLGYLNLNNTLSNNRSLIVTEQPTSIQITDSANMNPTNPMAKVNGEIWGAEGLGASTIITTKYSVTTSDGFTVWDSSVSQSSGNAIKYEAYAGKTFLYSVSNHTVYIGQEIILTVAVRGQGTLYLEIPSASASIPPIKSIEKSFNNTNFWTTITVQINSNQNSAASLYVRTSSKCWIDRVLRNQ